jgi:hypothetical protein
MRKRLSPKYWAAWLISFLVLEITAVIKGGGTLSHYVSRFFGVTDKPMKYHLPTWALVLVVLWLLLHWLKAFQWLGEKI